MAGKSQQAIDARSPRPFAEAQFAWGKPDESIDLAQPIVVEGELHVIRHRARDQFRAFVELWVVNATRVW